MNAFHRSFIAGFLSTIIAAYAFAGPITTTEGISGDVDLHDRNPTLSFGKDVFSDSSRILVDAVVQNGELSKYPIRFDFFINGNLVLSQFRSQELNIPVGITLTKVEYPLPYNYTIVATLVTPNRNFTTTAYGAVTEADAFVETPTPTPVSAVDDFDSDVEPDDDDSAEASSATSIQSNDTTLELVK